ncbi:MAG: hypothetical protein KAS32_24500 [Candidatus Peribacteraceae bacterium]|nr:hypothetical protein [Candidatus Peribacteraceae bacterium]
MKDGERDKAMQALLDSDGWRFVVVPAFAEKRESLVKELLNVSDMKAFWNVKHAIHALDNTLSMVEMMGNPEKEPELEDTSLRPSEGL